MRLSFFAVLRFASKTEIAITVDGDTASAYAVIDGEQVELDALVQDFMASDAGVPFRLAPPEIGPAEAALRGLFH